MGRKRKLGRKKKYRYHKTKEENTKIANFLVTDRKMSDFKSIRPAIKYLLSKEENYRAVVKALNEQMPKFFEDAENNPNLVDLDRNREDLVDFIDGRMKATQEIYRKRGIEPTVTQLINSEFRTETYLSREDRILMNLEKIYSKREKYEISIAGRDEKITRSRYKYHEERRIFKEKLGLTNLNKANLEYLDKLPYGMTLSPHSQNRGYQLSSGDKKVIIELIRVQKGNGEYEEEMVVRYLENGKWRSL